MIAQNCGNHYKKSCIKLSYLRFSRKFFSQVLPVCHEIQKRSGILSYIFWDKAPFFLYWKESWTMHLTLKETKLKLKLQN